MFATLSPDGRRVAYVRAHNLYVEDLATGGITQLTTDGSPTLINGTFDWVYEEEFSLRNGFRWSPDGQRIAYVQNSERLINALVAADKPFSMMAYPNRTHCICEGSGTSLHVFSLLERYLHDHVPAGAS